MYAPASMVNSNDSNLHMIDRSCVPSSYFESVAMYTDSSNLCFVEWACWVSTSADGAASSYLASVDSSDFSCCASGLSTDCWALSPVSTGNETNSLRVFSLGKREPSYETWVEYTGM